jgi:hypothetical protein
LVVGIELAADRVRAVGIERWRGAHRQTFQCAWDPAQPADAVAQLRANFGDVRAVALSIGVGFLQVKHVKLPPIRAAERRRMIALEPDRFFAACSSRMAVAIEAETNVAFAADAELLQHWIDAFQAWALVETIEPAPISIARAMARNDAEGVVALTANADEWGIVDVQHGVVHTARRVLKNSGDPPAQPIPSLDGLAPEYACALGAAHATYAPVHAMLTTGDMSARITRGRAQHFAMHAVACVAASVLMFWSLAFARERKLHRVEKEIAFVQPSAQPAIALSSTLAGLAREHATGSALLRQRTDPLLVMAALSKGLPEGAVVLNLHARGVEWQIDGTARDAAAIVPALDRDGRFEDVRFVSASSRFQEGSHTYETFSIAFRVRATT